MAQVDDPQARPRCELVVPDAGPLITLAYAGRLDLLLAPGIDVVVVDMVRHELTRSATPTSRQILEFLSQPRIRIAETDTGREAGARGPDFRRRHAGERAIQDFLFDQWDRSATPGCALLLFEDHTIAGTTFVLPDNVFLLSTRAFLQTLQQRGYLESADAVLDAALAAGRQCSLRLIRQPPKAAPDTEPF